MATKHTDSWAIPERGFEPYAGPRGVDEFEPLDTQASDLAVFLQAALQRIRHKEEPSVSWVKLPSGVTAQLTRKAADQWELAIPIRRDWFQVIEGRSQDEVLRIARETQESEREKKQ